MKKLIVPVFFAIFGLACLVSLKSGTAADKSTEKSANISNIFVSLSKKMTPAVVNINTTTAPKGSWKGRDGGSPEDQWRKFFEDFFGGTPGGEPFGGPHGQQNIPKAVSLGSGFVIEASNGSGLILTNNHVVEGADEIKIKFTEDAGEKESDAEVIGSDPDLDVALIKVKTDRKLSPVKLGDSDQLEVGEWVAALGNPFGHGHSVTHGIVSAKERSFPEGFGKYIQVDAPINPGNSGGPLVNLDAEVVGINNAIDPRGPGIGFAIPINQVKMIIEQLKTKGRVDRGYIGVNVAELRQDLAKTLKLDEHLNAPIITNVVPGQPADKAGLQVYDVVTEVAGKRVYTANDLVMAVTNIPVGDTVKLKVIRSGKEKITEVKVAKRPDFRDAKNRSRVERNKKTPKGPKIDSGMTVEQIDPDMARELGLPESFQGIVVSQIVPGGAAHEAGISRGDVILEIDRKSVKTEDDFHKIVNAKKTYLLRVRKQDESGSEVFSVVALKLGE